MRSSAQKTPRMSVSMARNAIMYSGTRFSIVFDAAMQIGMMKVVNSTNRIEIPSTPIL